MIGSEETGTFAGRTSLKDALLKTNDSTSAMGGMLKLQLAMAHQLMPHSASIAIKSPVLLLG